MHGLDLEAEYNNRARVPEHQQIFDQWTRDGAAYRARAGAENRATLGLRYGPGPRQTLDIFQAENQTADAAPLAMFIHGGWWRSLEHSQFSHMAAGLNDRGITVAVAGYDLCPQVTIATIITQMRQACVFLWRRLGRPLMVYGHSAGGHLAGAMLATDWTAVDPSLPARLVPNAFSVSGIFDLTPLVRISVNQDLRLDDAEARRVSPVFWPAPAGTRLDSLVGALESSEFLRQARLIADTWGKAGVATDYDTVADKNHFTVCDALSDGGSAMVERLVKLATL